MKLFPSISCWLLLAITMHVFASGTFEEAWSSLIFETPSGYRVEISLGENDKIERLRVEFKSSEINIPESTYQGIENVDLSNVRLLQSGRGYDTLAIPAWKFGEGADYSNEVQVFYFYFENRVFSKSSSEAPFTQPWIE